MNKEQKQSLKTLIEAIIKEKNVNEINQASEAFDVPIKKSVGEASSQVRMLLKTLSTLKSLAERADTYGVDTAITVEEAKKAQNLALEINTLFRKLSGTATLG